MPCLLGLPGAQRAEVSYILASKLYGFPPEEACLSPGNQAVTFEATVNQSQEEVSTLNWTLGLSVLERKISL